jgi:hypothetical protein
MQDFGCTFAPRMKSPCNYCHMSQKGMKDEMEGMYPQIYMIIYPHVKHHCHMLEMQYGHMHHHTREEIEDITEHILKGCEKDLNEYFKFDDENENDYEHEEDHDHEHKHHHRQFGYGRRAFAGDLVRILLLRELLGRRPYGPFNPYYGYPVLY